VQELAQLPAVLHNRRAGWRRQVERDWRQVEREWRQVELDDQQVERNWQQVERDWRQVERDNLQVKPDYLAAWLMAARMCARPPRVTTRGYFAITNSSASW